MIEKLKEFAWGIIGIIFMVALAIGTIFLLKGAAWISVKVFPWLYVAFFITLGISIFIFMPLAIFGKTRNFAGSALVIASYIFGINLWVYTFLLTYMLWGLFAVFVGLCIFGVGVVPIALIAAIFNGLWSSVGDIVFLIVSTFGIRALGLWVMSLRKSPTF